MLKFGLTTLFAGILIGAVILLGSFAFSGLNHFHMIAPKIDPPHITYQKSYFTSFHALDNLMESFVHIEGDSIFDATVYSVRTGRLLDSASGIIREAQLQTNSGRIVGHFENGLIYLDLVSTTIACLCN